MKPVTNLFCCVLDLGYDLSECSFSVSILQVNSLDSGHRGLDDPRVGHIDHFFSTRGSRRRVSPLLEEKKIIYSGTDNKMKICNDYNIWKLYLSYKIGDKFFIFFLRITA